MWRPFKPKKQGPCTKEFAHEKLWRDQKDVMAGETACLFKCECGCHNYSWFGQWDISKGVYPWN